MKRTCNNCKYLQRCYIHPQTLALGKPPVESFSSRVLDVLATCDRVASMLTREFLSYFVLLPGALIGLMGLVYVFVSFTAVFFRPLEVEDFKHYYQGLLMLLSSYYLLREGVKI